MGGCGDIRGISVIPGTDISLEAGSEVIGFVVQNWDHKGEVIYALEIASQSGRQEFVIKDGPYKDARISVVTRYIKDSPIYLFQIESGEFKGTSVALTIIEAAFPIRECLITAGPYRGERTNDEMVFVTGDYAGEKPIMCLGNLGRLKIRNALFDRQTLQTLRDYLEVKADELHLSANAVEAGEICIYAGNHDQMDFRKGIIRRLDPGHLKGLLWNWGSRCPQGVTQNQCDAIRKSLEATIPKDYNGISRTLEIILGFGLAVTIADLLLDKTIKRVGNGKNGGPKDGSDNGPKASGGGGENPEKIPAESKAVEKEKSVALEKESTAKMDFVTAGAMNMVDGVRIAQTDEATVLGREMVFNDGVSVVMLPLTLAMPMIQAPISLDMPVPLRVAPMLRAVPVR